MGECKRVSNFVELAVKLQTRKLKGKYKAISKTIVERKYKGRKRRMGRWGGG